MATPQSRKPMFAFLTQHLPAFFHKELPLPAILTTPMNLGDILRTPIHIPGISSKRSRRKSFSKRTISTARVANSKGKTGQFVVEGSIQRGEKARFAIDNKDFDIDANTWIIGNVEYGAWARVKGCTQGDKKIASQVVILKGAEITTP